MFGRNEPDPRLQEAQVRQAQSRNILEDIQAQPYSETLYQYMSGAVPDFNQVPAAIKQLTDHGWELVPHAGITVFPSSLGMLMFGFCLRKPMTGEERDKQIEMQMQARAEAAAQADAIEKLRSS